MSAILLRTVSGLTLLIGLFFITGCQQQDQPRRYTELVAQTAQTANLYWDVPKGWKQGPDKAMRLASFYLEADPDAIDCSVVLLPGMAGGVEANLKRWMGQAGIEPSGVNYQKLLDTARAFQTRGALQAKVFDIAPGMIAAIITTDEATIFLKMTGTREHVKENEDGFLELLKSLALK